MYEDIESTSMPRKRMIKSFAPDIIIPPVAASSNRTYGSGPLTFSRSRKVDKRGQTMMTMIDNSIVTKSENPSTPNAPARVE